MSGPEKDRPDGSPPSGGKEIQSDVLLTLVHTRAHILSVMANPRLTPLAKQVACVLWAVSETWNPGEKREVTMPQIAQSITYTTERGGVSVEVHPDTRRVGDAAKLLESEGYVSLRSPTWGAAGVGRGSTTGISMIRRTVADPYTHGEKVFRAWTQKTLEDAREIVAAVMQAKEAKEKAQRAAAPSEKAGRKAKGGSATAPSTGKAGQAATPSEMKGGQAATPSAQEGGASDPLQVVDLKNSLVDLVPEPDLREQISGPPPLSDGFAADASSHSEGAETGTAHGRRGQDDGGWAAMRDSKDVVNCLHLNLTDAGRDLFTRDRRLEAINCLDRLRDGYEATAREWLYLLSAWAGQTECQHADKIAQYITRYRSGHDVRGILREIGDCTPADVVALGLGHGQEVADEVAAARKRRAERGA